MGDEGAGVGVRACLWAERGQTGCRSHVPNPLVLEEADVGNEKDRLSTFLAEAGQGDVELTEILNVDWNDVESRRLCCFARLSRVGLCRWVYRAARHDAGPPAQPRHYLAEHLARTQQS